MHARYIPLVVPSPLRTDATDLMSMDPSSSLSMIKPSPLPSAFTSPPLSPPSSPRLRSGRIRTLSIASVSSTTSEAIASQMRTLSIWNDGSNTEDEPMDTPTNEPCCIQRFEPGAPLVDYTNEPGYEEIQGPVNVYIAVEPSFCENTSDDRLWILFWHVGSQATGVRVIRRGGTLLCNRHTQTENEPEGEAIITTMKSNETLAGTKDLKMMHMEHRVVGCLTLKQRQAFQRVASRTSRRELSARSSGIARARLLSHREWIEAIMQEAIEGSVVVHHRVTQAFSELLGSNSW